MAFEISGYVVEGMRVGQSNGTFTQTPDNLISNQGAFNAAYPADESAPRADYMVLVTSEGSPPGLLESAKFGWTKNEGLEDKTVARFGYDAQGGAFKPLRGAAPVDVGTLSEDSNTARLRVRPPVHPTFLPQAPYRLSVGTDAWDVKIVMSDLAFGDPPAHTAELSMETGNLNWNAADLASLTGQRVRFQQQQFYELRESTGNLGIAPIALSDSALMLNPLPGPGQFPRLRFGYGFYLTAREVATFSSEPDPGIVEWLTSTGELKFNPADAADHAGVPVYYDGVLFGVGLGLPVQSLGDISNPRTISSLPPLGAALIFALPGADPYYRFPSVIYRAFNPPTSGKKGEVLVDPTTRKVRFSAVDQDEFAGQDVDLYFGDLPIEHGISVRFLRNPVNLDAARPLKDVTAIYQVEGATWADPIIQSPQVSLPSLPIEDPDYLLTVKVVQGQGSYVNDNFPNLNVPDPPVGLGYYIDFDGGLLFFAQRKVDELVPILSMTSDIVLPDPLLLSSNLEFELVSGSNVKPLVIGEDVLVDTTAGVVSLTSTNTLAVEGTASVSGTTLTDLGAQFQTDGVQAGYLVVLANESLYTVASVTDEFHLELDQPVSPAMPSVTYAIYGNREILADRYFAPVVLLDPSTKVERIRGLGVASNSPRLTVPVAYVGSSGFRLGATQGDGFATVVLVQGDPPAFSSPASLPAGTVELSEETGAVNFASADLGKSIYWAQGQTPGKDYELEPELGLVHFRDRMLAKEEVRITYTVAPPSTLPPTLPGPPITEYATFLIRKEVTAAHPTPTSTLSFNKAGLPVTLEPAPAVFRGGRPQKLGIQCVVDPALSQITFLPDSQITDALPHGATIAPNERVYIDYYVTQAVGGEKTFTVLHPPILTSEVEIQDIDLDGKPNNKFVVHGDHTATFQAGYLMRIENEQVYLLAAPTYDAGQDETTVVLSGEQVFQEPFTDPRIYVSSGPTPISAAPSAPAYFTSDLPQAFEAIPRGSNTFVLAGNQTLLYRPNTVVMFTDSAASFTDFVQVSGSAYEANTDRTVVMLFDNTLRQYVSGEQLLYRSVRPVFEPLVTEVQTSRVPKLSQPYLVYRRVSGEPGQALSSPVGYTINGSGHIIFAEPLGPLEEFAIFYTGLTTIAPGTDELPVNLRASYTCQIAPSTTNGLLGQTLLADYYINSPDTFYYRVETKTNFRGEFRVEIATEASSGSSGPQTSNAAQPDLWEQGRKSLYFDERHLANQDIIARSTLLYYNDLVTLLERYKRALDGSVVGNNDGYFLFDGTTGTVRVPPELPENQIDDAIKVSPAPYTVTGPPFVVTSKGTYRKYYTPGNLSRFYPTQKNFFGVTAITSTTVPGDEILDTGAENVTIISGLHTRLAWALVTKKAYAGELTVTVDDANGSSDYVRPPFLPGMKCVIQNPGGTFVHGTGSPVTIAAGGVTATSLTFTAGLSAAVQKGCTIYRSPGDDSAQTDPNQLINYVLNKDYSFASETGQVTYVAANGITLPGAGNNPLVANEALSGLVSFTSKSTAPEKFPALYGGIEDDDGDLSFPVQTPDPASEQKGYLDTETATIGAILALTEQSSITTGTMVETFVGSRLSTTLTFSGGITPSTIRVYDVVRIVSGTNAGTAFRRVVSSTGTSLTVSGADSWTYQAGTTSFEIATATPVATGSQALFPSLTSLTDAGANFTSTAKVGETVVITSNLNQGLRRQIQAVTNGQTLVLDKPVSSMITNPVSLSSYRVIASLTSYGNTSSDLKTTLTEAVSGELLLYPKEQQYLLDFLNLAFTDVIKTSPLTGSVAVATLTDNEATFFTSGVKQQDAVYIESGANAGIYVVKSLTETQLVTYQTFPATGSVTYRVVSVSGISIESAESVFALYQTLGTQYDQALAFYNALAPAPVVANTVIGDPNAYVTSLRDATLNARLAQVSSRAAEIPAALDAIADIVVNVDQLYDKRYVWIDARINLEDGLLVQQDTAVKNRIKAQAANLKQLTKLLAVGGA